MDKRWFMRVRDESQQTVDISIESKGSTPREAETSCYYDIFVVTRRI